MIAGFSSETTTFREAWEALLVCHDAGLINDEELLLLCDVNMSENPDILSWNYGSLILDSHIDNECLSEFCFERNDIDKLHEVLGFSDTVP